MPSDKIVFLAGVNVHLYLPGVAITIKVNKSIIKQQLDSWSWAGVAIEIKIIYMCTSLSIYKLKILASNSSRYQWYDWTFSRRVLCLKI